MKNIKKILALFLILSICSSLFYINIDTIFAFENSNNNGLVFGAYSGEYDSGQPMIFSISTVDVESKTFTGHVRIEDSVTTVDKDISGKIPQSAHNVRSQLPLQGSLFSSDLGAIF